MSRHGALAGITVIDFSTLLPGPMASLFLAEAGAEVIKVENPARGDEMRSYAPKWGRDSVNFHMLNRGKQSLALDLKSPEARTQLDPLLASADILIEQYRPGVMARLGLSYEAVRAINPRIIYCSITGYGQTGERSLRAGHDLNYIGDTGMLALSHGTAETPVIPPALIADIAGGAYPALVNILLALRHRDQTGEGAHIDIAMADNLFPFLYWAQGEGQAARAWPGNADALVTGGSCRYNLYPSADGRFIAVAAIEPKFWALFCEAIGLDPELRDDAATPEATRTRIGDLLKAKDSAHWAEVFHTADCCCTVIATLQEAMAEPHFRSRSVFASTLAGPNGETMPALPTGVAQAFRKQADGPLAAPALGEHNARLTAPSERS